MQTVKHIFELLNFWILSAGRYQGNLLELFVPTPAMLDWVDELDLQLWSLKEENRFSNLFYVSVLLIYLNTFQMIYLINNPK